MKYFSTFSGIGGFERGIELAYERHLDNRRTTSPSTLEKRRDKPLSDNSNGNGRWTSPVCVGYSEIDKYATAIYQKHFPNHKNYGDITKIDPKDLPDFELLVGGFPCQSFSIAGKRGGFADTRGTMFFEIARIVEQKQPRLLLLENVRGLLSHDQGRTFLTIITTLDELGYDCQWQVLNSKNHGVPQNRERVFIVGHLRGTPRPQVFPFGETDGVTDQRPKPQNTEIAATLRSRYGNGSGSHIKQLNNPTHSNNRVYSAEGISPTLNTMQGGGRQPFIQQKSQGKNKGGKHDIEPTMSSNSWQDNNHLNTMGRIRRLTPVECERLQGFPDGWTEGVSDTQRYKTLGNAVTVNVIRDIVSRMI